MFRDDVRYWAGLVAAAALALTGAVTMPHPWDQVVMGVAAVAGAIAAYAITPAGSVKETK